MEAQPVRAPGPDAKASGNGRCHGRISVAAVAVGGDSVSAPVKRAEFVTTVPTAVLEPTRTVSVRRPEAFALTVPRLHVTWRVAPS